MNTATEPTIQDLLDALNGYDGNDIWNDIIFRWDQWIDWEATAIVGAMRYSDSFVTKRGVRVDYHREDGTWRSHE